MVPSQRTMYRLFDTLARGRHTTGSAPTRRGLAGRPEGMFSTLPAAAPGDWVQIDSTPLDVLVLLDDGVPGRVELTGMIDVATRVVPAAVLRPTTRSVDASVLLARAVTPEPMRPGWPEALKMAHSVLPHARLLSIDERLEHAAAKPVIVPDTIVIDHGSVFVSHNPWNDTWYDAVVATLAPAATGGHWRDRVDRRRRGPRARGARHPAAAAGPVGGPRAAVAGRPARAPAAVLAALGDRV
ncbi:MAG TPA: hypothetical protein VIU11_25545 [Nakamurella sp.]